MNQAQNISVATFLASLCALSTALSQTVTRGPYLQLPKPNSVTVKWRTDLSTDSVVRYGTSVGIYPFTSSSASPDTKHEINVGGLQPDTQYFYTVGNSSGSLAGGDESFSFVTSPPDDVDTPTRIWITGDAGTADANAVAVRDAYQTFTGTRHTDLFMTLGDIAYSHGTDQQYQNAFFDMYPQVLRQTPVWPTYGNHDGLSADAATETGPYFEIFTLPKFSDAYGVDSETEAYYSFDYGIIHFISLDSFESDRTSSGDMIPWLTNDLTANNKQWTIAFWHHPPYSKGSHDSDNSAETQMIQMRQNALSILESYGVDLVLTGHSHSYERSFLLDGHYGNSNSLTEAMKLDDGSGREDGTGAYNKSGIAGTPHEGAVYAVAGSSGKTTSADLDHPAMFISLLSLGSMVLDVAGNRLEAKFLDDEGAVLDYFTLVKGQDSFAPLIVSAQAESDTLITVEFSEPMDSASTGVAANYTISGLAISQATLQADERTVELTTTPMLGGTSYTLTVNNTEDLAGNPISPNSQELFAFSALTTLVFQNGVAPSTAYLGARDAYLSEALSDTNFGGATTLLVDGDDGGGSDKTSLMAWDVTAIPSGSTVQSVSVIIEVTNPTNSLYAFREVKRDWQEHEATWNQYAAGMPWNAPGALSTGDRGATVLGVAAANTTGAQTFALNADGVALVQAWIDGTVPNYGFVLSDTSSSDGMDFWSSDVSTPTNRPQLSIEFQSPPSDTDNDGVPDASDNCINVPNGPLIPDAEGGASQQDDDLDNIGNACDLRVTTLSLPSGRVGNIYSKQLDAVRGQPPYAWTITSGAPPDSVTLNSNGLLEGAVQKTFLTFFTVQVTDSNGDTATQDLSIRVTIPNCVNCHAHTTM